MELSTSMLKKITKVTFLFFLHMLFAASIAQTSPCIRRLTVVNPII